MRGWKGTFCHDVKVEPQLQKVNEGDCLNPKTITGDQARLDVSARGVWTPFDKTFLDIRVSHPNCLSNKTKTLQEVYEMNENEKKDEYLERVLNVEKATFPPAVFLTSGGMSKDCKQFVNRLNNPYRSSWVQRKEDQHQTRGPFIRGLVQPHPCPDDGLDDVCRKFVCIYLIVYSSIGSNGLFPLPKYCALPIASLDLIVCTFCIGRQTLIGHLSTQLFSSGESLSERTPSGRQELREERQL